VDGQGLKLEPQDIDATHGKRAFWATLCDPADAIEVSLNQSNGKKELKVTAGHHTLG